MRPLSKSKILAYRQCTRRLWLEVHHPELCADTTDTESRFQVGHRVGEIARRIYDPNDQGELVDVESEGFEEAFSHTQDLLKNRRRPIFEAGFRTRDALAFVDVLKPARKGLKGWRLVEVKSSTSVKDYHRDDLAFQAWLARSAGLALTRISIAYVDNQWVYQGNGDYSGLLIEENLTKESRGRSEEVEDWVKSAQEILRRKKEPTVSPGEQCTHPYACSFIDHCRSREPQATCPVKWLPGKRTQALKRYIEDKGVIEMEDVPDQLLNERQQRVKDCTLSGNPYFDQAGAAKALAAHKPPAYFLDFETVMLAVPIWAGTRPYQQIPFQFSCHCIDSKGRLTHTPFLDTSGDDPSEPFISALLKACGERGPIFVYNESFEKTRIRELAERFPKQQRALLALIDRVVDLWPIAKDHYYHPDQAGSWSIKAVLPTIAPDLDYSQLTGVQDGSAAMLAYQEAIAAGTSRPRHQEIREQLLTYCERDTEALVRLWKYFSGKIKC